MTIGLFLDSNIWNFLFDCSLDLSIELPKDEYSLAITREGEIEFPPDGGALRKFVENTIQKCEIVIDSYFGFFQEQYPIDRQRLGGFDVGRFISPEEADFIQRQAKKVRTGGDRPHGLHKYEADVALGARSMVSIVVSLDAKKGPLKDALNEGGKIIFLTDFDASGLTLKEFILQKIAELNSRP